MNFQNMSKFKKLALSLIFDALGYVSLIFPPFDIVWAPLAAYLMSKMYKGNKGKIASAIVFIEEAMPFLDVIPTFTLMWLYSYIFKSKEAKIIEIKS
jgi:hypothetical protein